MVRRSQKNEHLCTHCNLLFKLIQLLPHQRLSTWKKTISEEKKNIDQTNDSQLISSQRFSVILQTDWIDLFKVYMKRFFINRKDKVLYFLYLDVFFGLSMANAAFFGYFFCIFWSQKYYSKPDFFNIAHNSLNNGLWAVLKPFLEFKLFWTFSG